MTGLENREDIREALVSTLILGGVAFAGAFFGGAAAAAAGGGTALGGAAVGLIVGAFTGGVLGGLGFAFAGLDPARGFILGALAGGLAGAVQGFRTGGSGPKTVNRSHASQTKPVPRKVLPPEPGLQPPDVNACKAFGLACRPIPPPFRGICVKGINAICDFQ